MLDMIILFDLYSTRHHIIGTCLASHICVGLKERVGINTIENGAGFSLIIKNRQ